MKIQLNLSKRKSLTRISICFLLLFSLLASAKEKKWQQTINGSAIANSAVISALDGEITTNSQYFIARSTSSVELKIEDFVGPFFHYNYSVLLEITPRLANGAVGTSYQTSLSVENNRYGNTGNFIDLKKHIIDGRGASVKVISFSGQNIETGAILSSTPANISLTVSYESERYYNFNTQSDVPASLLFSQDSNSTELTITWGAVESAEEYELQWAWVDNYSNAGLSSFIPDTELRFGVEDFEASHTSIQTTGLTYKIPLIYDNGYLIFRIRAIGRHANPDHDKKWYGAWNIAPGNENLFDSPFLTEWEANVVRTQAATMPKNWQFQASYAENGKKKEVVSYFDGSLRNRQTVTKINSSNKAIVGEIIYDDEGRPAVEILPVPSGESILKYYEFFNKNLAQQKAYSYQDFIAPIATTCNFSASGMHPSSGASKYYAPAGTASGTFQDFVPQAKNFPFSQIEYTPDNTGRIKRKGGVGDKHQLGSGHEMKYLYSTPTQEELNRLFGYNVGYASHYKKNTVIDPNGQVSITYLDPQGRTIATALGASKPDPMLPLADEQSTTLHKYIDVDLLNKQNATKIDTDQDNNERFSTGYYGNLEDGLRYDAQKVFVNPGMDYTFSYSLTKTNPFVYQCSLSTTYNYPFVYKLSRMIFNDCGEEIYTDGTSTNPYIGLGSYNYDGSGNVIVENSPTQPLTAFATEQLAPGSYSISKKLIVDSKALDVFADDYIRRGKLDGCILPPQAPSANLDGCFYTCEECADHYDDLQFLMSNNQLLHGKLAYVQIMLAQDKNYQDLVPGSPTYAVEAQLFVERYSTEWELLKKECLKPCATDGYAIGAGGEMISMGCDNSLNAIMGDMMPNGQYGVRKSDMDSEGNVIEGVIDPVITTLKMSVYNDSPTNAIRAFALGIDPTKCNWRYPHYYDKDGLLSSNDYKHYYSPTRQIEYVSITWDEESGTFTPPIILPNNEHPQPSDLATVNIVDAGSGLYKVEPQFLAKVEDFIKEIVSHESWALSLVKYHPEFHYMDYAYQTCKAGMTHTKTIGSNTVSFNSDGFDAFLGSFTDYQSAKDYGLLASSLTLFDADPFFQIAHPKDGSRLNPTVGTNGVVALPVDNTETPDLFLGVKQSIMRNSLDDFNDTDTPDLYEKTNDIMAYAIYKIMKCSGPNGNCEPIPVVATPVTFATVMAAINRVTNGFTTEEKNTFWQYYVSYYLSLKQKIQYSFISLHAARQGFYNDCIGNEASQNLNRVTNVITNYPNQKGKVSTWLNAIPAITLFSQNAAFLKDKEKRFLPYDETYDSDDSTADIYQDMLGEFHYNYLSTTGNCPIINDLYIFLNYLTKDTNVIPRRVLRGGSGTTYDAFDGNYLTPALLNGILQGTGTTSINGVSSSPFRALTIRFKRGDVASNPMILTIPAGLTGTSSNILWSNYRNTTTNGWFITEISDLSKIGTSTSPDHFSFVAKIHNNNGSADREIVITGTLSAILSCSTNPQTAANNGVPYIGKPDDGLCTKKQDFANALRDLIKSMQTSVPSTVSSSSYNLLNNLTYKNGYLPEFFGIQNVPFVRWEYTFNATLNQTTCLIKAGKNSGQYQNILKLTVSGNLLSLVQSVDIGNLMDTSGTYVWDAADAAHEVKINATGIVYTGNIGANNGALEFRCCAQREAGSENVLEMDDFFELTKRVYNEIIDHCMASSSVFNWPPALFASDSYHSPAVEALGNFYNNPDFSIHNLHYGIDTNGNLGIMFDNTPSSATGCYTPTFLSVPFGARVEKVANSTTQEVTAIWPWEFFGEVAPNDGNYIEVQYFKVFYTDGSDSGSLDTNVRNGCLKSFTYLPTCPCYPQTVTAVACTDKYADYQNLVTNYGHSNMSSIEFCNKKFAYIIDGYNNYLTTMGINSSNYSTHDYFITLAQFGSSDFNYAYNEEGNGYLIAIGEFKNYLDNVSDDIAFPQYLASDFNYYNDINQIPFADNDTETDPELRERIHYDRVDTWLEFATLYIHKKKICPPAPMHTKHLYIKAPETASPCMEFNSAVEDTYNAAAYEAYILALKMEFKKAYIKQALEDAVEQLRLNFYDKEYQYTLYYYDQAGNLIQTVAPEGVRRMTGTVTQNNSINNYRFLNTASENSSLVPSHVFKTQYKYNSLNQLIWQSTPDGGETLFAYDKLGRIIASQNTNQQATLFSPEFIMRTGLERFENGVIKKATGLSWLGANTNVVLPANGNVQFRIQSQGGLPVESKDAILGLAYSNNTSSETSVRYAYYLNGIGNFPMIRQNEANMMTLSKPVEYGMVYKIERLDGYIRWYEGNQLVYQVPEQSPGQPMIVDLALYREGTALTNILVTRYDENKFSYTSYDKLGRIKEAGQIFKHPGRVMIDQYGKLVYLLSGLEVPTADSYPHNISDDQIEVTKTIYDNYGDFDENAFLTALPVQDPPQIRNIRNRVGAILTFGNANAGTLMSDYETAIFYNYDIHGNVDEMVQSISSSIFGQGKLNRVNYKYDLISGNVNKVTFQKNTPEQFIHSYAYDADNRIINVQTSRDGTIWEKDASYEYYDHGPLARVVLGDKKVQGIDYAYTLQGWLKTVNSENMATANKDMGKDGNYISKDAYSYSLSYFNNDYLARNQGTNTAHTLSPSNASFQGTELFNGNINRMITSLRNTSEDVLPTQVNLYRYDQLNRIFSMNSLNGIEGSGTFATSYGSTYSYDRNGNLKTLTRTAPKDVAPNVISPVAMDNFTYNYLSGTNKLRHIGDSVVASTFGDATHNVDIDNQTADNYTYDGIGQLIGDRAEKIQNIFWRVDGKVKSVVKTNGNSISFYYDGLGNRVSKKSIVGSSQTGSHYARDAQGNVMGVYEFEKVGANALQYGLKEHHIYGSNRLGLQSYEGTAVLPSAHERLVGDKRYELTNHLGNVLSVVNDRKIIESDVLLLNTNTFDSTIGGWVAFGNTSLSVASRRLIVQGSLINTGTVFSIGLTAGIPHVMQLSVFKTQSGFPMRLEIRNPTGTLLYSQPIVEEQVTTAFTPPSTGTYSIRVLFDFSQSNASFAVDNFYLYRILAPSTDFASLFLPDVLDYNDYYPFGMIVPDPRNTTDSDYRYGYNGMEKDDEIKGGDGNSYDFGARMYDPRAGRWFANDPSAHLQPSSSPYSFANNNPVVLVDPNGELPILPLLLKAGISGGADMMMQVAMSYYFDDDVKTLGQAFDKVDYVQVARSAAEGLIPWKVPGGKLGEAGATALGDVIINATNAGLAGKNYSKSQAIQDFTAGFLSELAGGEIADLVKKFGGNKVRQVFKKLGLKDPCGCFTAGTQVYTDKGYKNIEEVQVGDIVWAFDEQKGTQELKKVINTFTKTRDHIYKIHFGDHVIEATDDHPFFIGGQWLKVKNLKVGDLLTLYDGNKLSISKIEFVKGEYAVFNFEVEDDHTYYVSLGNVLVHNSGPCDWSPKQGVPSKIGDVASYKDNLKNAVKGDKLTPDHIPSFAAVKKAVENSLGGALSPTQARELKQITTTLVIPEEMHNVFSETFKGRNGSQRVLNDAMNLRAAAESNMKALKPALLKKGYTTDQIESMFSKVREANEKVFKVLKL